MTYEDILLPTAFGDAPDQVARKGPFVQLQLFFPAHGGSGLFVMFPATELDAAKSAMAELIGRGPLGPDLDLTSTVPDASAAGTMPRPTFSIGSKDFVLGQPNIKHGG